MARYLYTVSTEHNDDQYRCVAELELALEAEFPAFRVCERAYADARVALVVREVVNDVPAEAWERLDGWGAAGLTLELVR